VQRTDRVFGVEPAADVQHRGRDALRRVLPQRAHLPEVVVVGMIDDLLEVRPLALEQARVDGGQRAEAEKELVAVRRAVVEGHARLRRRRRLAARPKVRVEPEVGRQHERAVVIHVVAEIVVGGGRLW
jgi:hypothetical protein